MTVQGCFMRFEAIWTQHKEISFIYLQLSPLTNGILRFMMSSNELVKVSRAAAIG